MTLRATLEIVPFGDENNKRELGRLNISNVEVVRSEGFGHDICRYRVELERPDTIGEFAGEYKEGIRAVDFIEEHDRRDGAVALVEKAAALMKDQF
jgi:hypothetical protein